MGRDRTICNGGGWRTCFAVGALACLLAGTGPALASDTQVLADFGSRADQLAAAAAAQDVEIKGLHKVSGPALGLARERNQLTALLDGLGHVLIHAPDGRLQRIVILRAKQTGTPPPAALSSIVVSPAGAVAFAFAADDLAARIFGDETEQRVTSNYGRRRDPLHGKADFHAGVDFAARRGTEVRAIADGFVERAGRRRGLGLFVLVRHDDAHQSLYAHLGSLAPGLRPGRRLPRGAVIARSGSTGRTTGPHLHFELWVRGEPVDPLRYRFDSVTLAAR